MSDKKRCVITGVGAIAPNSVGSDAFWEASVAGVSGIAPITGFDTSRFRTHLGGEIKGFCADDFISKPIINKIGKASQLAISATRMAIECAGLDEKTLRAERCGVSFGTTMGEIQEEERISEDWVQGGVHAASAESFLKYPSDRIPNNVMAYFGFNGPAIMIPTACASGNYAIGYAFDQLTRGTADVMIAGGVDPLSRVAFAGFNSLHSIAPEKCQPFDAERKGMMVGEGVGALLLETLERAEARGARIMAEIIGYGLGCDAFHMTTPHPQGMGGVTAVESAIHMAGIDKSSVNYISAHGTGTKENDRIETKIIKTVFKEDAYRIPVSSAKSMIGHTMGAASGLEAVICVYVAMNDVIPPTINYSTPDPECDLDYVANVSRKHTVNVALSNAFAFGGNDAAILVAKYRG